MAEVRKTRELFLGCMAVVYMFAFASLFVQIPGLYGDNGIQPAKLALKKVPESIADWLEQFSLLRLLPLVGVTDAQTGMDVLCLAGVILSFCAFIVPRLRTAGTFLALWFLYLSLFQVGQTFLWFQWDTLLLETGALTVLVAPLGWLTADSARCHDNVTLWLVRWLAFRLMFASGVVKLTSGCPTWWGLTAMTYHYESQCIPTAPAWYFHQLPVWFQRSSVVVVYLTEVALPFLFFSPIRSQRVIAGYAQLMLMFLIALTGNYNFFNLLTAVLFVSLLNDEWLQSWARRSPRKSESGPQPWFAGRSVGCVCVVGRLLSNVLVYGSLLYWTITLFSLRINFADRSIESKIVFDMADLNWFLARVVPLSIWIGIISLGFEILSSLIRALRAKCGVVRKLWAVTGCVFFSITAITMFCISLVPYSSLDSGTQQRLPQTIRHWHQSTSHSLQLTHSYGLFRSMTGVGGRPELIVEGSDSMEGGWQEYNFLYKPGSLSRQPPFVAPHQPRLDWQMWFAALGTYEHNSWFLNLVYRLLDNQPDVTHLMDNGPFDRAAPKYIRAQLYHYHYTSLNASASASDWWTRKHVRQYLPTVWLEEPGLVNYLKKANIYKDAQGEEPEVTRGGVLKGLMDVVHALFTPADGLNVCAALLFTGVAFRCIRGVILG